MCIKKHLKIYYYNTKAIRVFVLVALLFIIALTVIMYLKGKNTLNENELYYDISKVTELYFPVLNFLPLMALIRIFTNEGCEILYVSERNKMTFFLFYFLLEVGILLVPFIILAIIFGKDIWWIFLANLLIHGFYVSIAYCTAYISKQADITMGVSVALLVGSIMMEYMAGKGSPLVFRWGQGSDTLVLKCAAILLLTLIFFCIGRVANNRKGD